MSDIWGFAGGWERGIGGGHVRYGGRRACHGTGLPMIWAVWPYDLAGKWLVRVFDPGQIQAMRWTDRPAGIAILGR